MTGTVLMIVLFAALLHASWNFLVKRTENKYVSMSAMVCGVILLRESINTIKLPANTLTLLGMILLRIKP